MGNAIRKLFDMFGSREMRVVMLGEAGRGAGAAEAAQAALPAPDPWARLLPQACEPPARPVSAGFGAAARRH